jgi:hypothetical protein
MPLIKQAAFAELHGVSRKTVTMWKKRDWLVFQADLVDVDASNELLKKYRRDGIEDVTSPVTQAASGNKTPAPKIPASQVTVIAGETVEQAVVRVLGANGAEMSFEEARRVKENYLALLNQLEYDKESGLVVEAAEVAKAVGAEYAKVRTRLLAIPAEQAPRVHRLRTVNEVQDCLHELIQEALKNSQKTVEPKMK